MIEDGPGRPITVFSAEEALAALRERMEPLRARNEWLTTRIEEMPQTTALREMAGMVAEISSICGSLEDALTMLEPEPDA